MSEVSAREIAMNRIGVREYSASEMRAYLKRKGYGEGEIDEAVRELVDRGLIDDRRYSRVVARHQAMRERGPLAVLMKLKQKGVRADMREARALFAENSDIDEIEMVRRVIARRYATLDPRDRKAVARAYGGLVRRGFAPSIVQACLRELRADTPAAEDPDDDI